MARRDEDKKRRRQKRLAKRARRQMPADELERTFHDLNVALNTPQPEYWPGAADASLSRPDMVKFQYADFTYKSPTGKTKGQQLENQLDKGLIGFLPELDHWAIEEFLWHGLPGDAWHPLDAYLQHAGSSYPPDAQAQLRLWKEARIGLFEVGPVEGETVKLREWDPVGGCPSGPIRQAISLGIGGSNSYRGHLGHISLTYLAPWSAADDLFCALGYGQTLPKNQVALLVPYLGLQHPYVVTRPLPWKVSPATFNEHMRLWRAREWQGWLSQRVSCPFPAIVAWPPPRGPQITEVRQLIPASPEKAYEFGIYFDVPYKNEWVAVGATTVTPVDVTSSAFAALREYQAYRQRVGKPPGVRGQPDYFGLP